MEDLKTFAKQGVSDLLDYGKEWEFGKLKLDDKNKQKQSFKQKYKKSMDENM